jgi:beta-lactamase regulating signal transducer with metallopeptidase domain
MAWQIRVLGFLVVMLLLPVCTFMFVRAMVAKRSNRVNAFMLGIYTVVDMVFAFFMVGGSFVSMAATVIFIPREQQLCFFAKLLEGANNHQRRSNVTEVTNVNRARGTNARGANVFFFFGVASDNPLGNFF